MIIETDERSQISVIIPVHNSATTLYRCLESLSHQTKRPKEVIIIDDASSDSSLRIASEFSIQVHTIEKQPSAAQVRQAGFIRSKGDIVVNIDSDVVIASNTLEQIELFMDDQQHASAVTGILDLGSLQNSFFTRYKHLYMNYIFNLLGNQSNSREPQKITFLYGSLFALRGEIARGNLIKEWSNNVWYGVDDTGLGQLLYHGGYDLYLLPYLLVQHLKVFSLFKLLRNDFLIPRGFAHIWCRFNGGHEFVQNKAVFLHTNYKQVASILSIYSFLLSLFIFPQIAALFLLLWLVLVYRFLSFLVKNGGLKLWQVVSFTFLDQFVMGLGICTGFAEGFFEYRRRRLS